MQLDTVAVGDYLTELQRGVLTWSHPLVFGAMFVECIPVVGVVAPGLTVLVVAGFVAGTQGYDYAMLSGAAALAGVGLSDSIAFSLGRAGASRIPALKSFVARHSALQRDLVEQRFVILCLYQFPPYSRMFAPLVLGAAHFPIWRWWPLLAVATIVFVGFFFGLGFAVARGGTALLGAVRIAGGITTVFVGALALWVLLLAARAYRRRQSRSAGSRR